ncbi:glyoxalase/bleomycin resistance protein/dioxygenase [Crepidotus variabilis]|uniref:Glyoxalase/bleomycin resistance protein/dioxygenase n=1 Tax=Crepidotus variabilis TaxID=179855 RepID=A0A9P6EI58_9AGAR|nr:glyoxalase/bleomycin resistance protein/dioxygenase [Crepidotus variabilis]
MSIHHLGIVVNDIDESREFYLAALKPLGYKIFVKLFDGKVLGLGPFTGPVFWLSARNVPSPDEVKELRTPTGPIHLAFGVSNRKKVREFYDAAIAAGGKCNGPPGPRPEYFITNYSAFVLDPEGRNIEAICLRPAFWAEPWGVLGWSAVSLVGGVGGGLIGKYMGWL